ncbi:Cyclin-d5-1 [Thalictrum thalictroides]|uniref:Cyclin-d5-1 n=1 Tax=Thalictrum thalictroides TaxID=46969 RepID=A0A7J6WPK5_THATH|nr:Cyclin-d5-1 [Thalictrum thalictroides]
MDSDGSSSVSLPNLLCRESDEDACFINEETEQVDSFFRLNNLFVSENDDEYIQMLIRRENTTFIDRSSSSNNNNNDCLMMKSNDDWLKCARLDSIQWILKIRTFLGFCFQTAYLSITYLDQFLSKRSIDSEKTWAIQLLSVACLTLAAKMEEVTVPALSEFSIEDYKFESKVIQRMELLVLNTLEWRMASITPFAYLHYFITKISDESQHKNNMVSRTVDHVLAIVKEMNLIDQRPSTIAVAAVLAASSKEFTRKMVELKMCSLSACGSLQYDNVFTCYNLMLDLEMEKVKTPKFVISPDLSSIYSSSTDVIGDSFFTSTSRSKRRRLTYNENCQMPNEKGLL